MDRVVPVTLVFLEIEDVAAAWQSLGGRVEAAFAALDDAVRAATTGAGGRVVKSLSGSAMLAFPAAGDAVRAALAIQERAAALATPFALRIGIHSGTPLHETDVATGREDFFGPDVNRAARLMSAGHPGQTLLSASTVAQAGQELESIAQVDLGEHRLRGLERPERVTQVLPAAWGTRAFPPLRTLTALPTNLPAQTTSFVGRAHELAALSARLADPAAAVTVVTGAAGAGKSRMAVRAAADALDTFPGGCWFVELSDLQAAEEVGAAVLAAFGVPSRAADVVADAAERLASRGPCLLVLDTADHLAPVLEPLLAVWRKQAPAARFLLTTRVAVAVPDSLEFRLEPLPLPDPSAPLPAIAACDSVRLFVERARDARPDFVLSQACAADVARICVELDGVPLAIELAAARSRILQPAELLRKLGQKFQLLRSTRKDITRRQQTLQGAIEWGEEQLEEADRAALRQLSVFHGGFSPEAADFVVDLSAFPGAATGSEAAARLARRSLLALREGRGGARFVPYRPVREHALRRLEESGGRDAVEARREAWFFRLIDDDAARTAQQHKGWDVFPDDIENLHDIHARAVARGPAGVFEALKAAVLIAKVTWRRGNLSRALQLLEPALAAARRDPRWPSLPIGVRALVLYNRASAVRQVGRFAESIPLLEEALEAARAAENSLVTGEILWDIAHSCGVTGDWERSDRALAESEAHARRHDLKVRLLTTLMLRSGRVQALGRFDEGLRLAEEALELARGTTRRDAVAEASNALGIALAMADRHADAVRALEEAVAIDVALGNRGPRALHLSNLADALAEQGAFEPAFRAFAESLKLFAELERPFNVAYTRMRYAEALGWAGAWTEAAREVADATPVLTTLGVSVSLRLAIVRAILAMRDDVPQEALAILDAAVPFLQQGQDLRDTCDIHALRVRALLALGRQEEAREGLSALMEMDRAGQALPSCAFVIASLMALAEDLAHRPGEARVAAQRARAIQRSLEPQLTPSAPVFREFDPLLRYLGA